MSLSNDLQTGYQHHQAQEEADSSHKMEQMGELDTIDEVQPEEEKNGQTTRTITPRYQILSEPNGNSQKLSP